MYNEIKIITFSTFSFLVLVFHFMNAKNLFMSCLFISRIFSPIFINCFSHLLYELPYSEMLFVYHGG